ncbi:hypothetical protein CBS9595_002518 [Malassezia furfur]|nr:hypothetical protein CBS9595_002518 [Malassezia furfur]
MKASLWYVFRSCKGRDRSYTPRLRLPSMEVSKHHARIFAIYRKKQFDLPPNVSLTDTGSTHGTFVYRPDTPNPTPMSRSRVQQIPEELFLRLSPEKHASRPFDLQHLDVIRFGVQSNVFEVHMHGNAWASCSACQLSPDGANEISLAPQARTTAQDASKKVPAGAQQARKTQSEKRKAHHETKQHLRELKKVYLKPVARGPASVDERPLYRDRASARRDLHPDAPPPVPRIGPSELRTEPLVSAEPAPLDGSNVGYQLLAKMAEGAEHIPQQDPIAPRVGAQRAGLGSGALVEPTERLSYQAHAKASTQQRYNAL